MLLPIGTDRRLQSFPFVTVSLIGVNLYLFFGVQTSPAGDNLPLVVSRFGWWMLTTHMFAHAHLWHLGTNMVFLWVFGGHAEDVLGRGRFLLVYFSAGLFAAMLHIGVSSVFTPGDLSRPMLGASGAIMGIVALFTMRFRAVRVRFFLWVWWFIRVFSARALWVGIAYIALDLLTGLLTIGEEGGGTAHWAHIGGFAAGILWAWILRLPAEGTDELKQDEVGRLIASGAWMAAAGLLEERIALRPGDHDLRRQAGMCYEMIAGGHKHAARHCNEALRLLLRSGQAEAAATQFRRLMNDFRPEEFDPAVLLRLGTALERMGAADLAASALLAIPRGHHDSPEAPTACLRAAELLGRTGRRHHARDLLEAIPRHWPDSHEALTATTKLRDGSLPP